MRCEGWAAGRVAGLEQVHLLIFTSSVVEVDLDQLRRLHLASVHVVDSNSSSNKANHRLRRRISSSNNHMLI